MTTQLTHAGFAAHAMLPLYLRKIEVALRLIAVALEQSTNPYVAWSVGGKDSTVMLHLIAKKTYDAIEARVLVSGETRYIFPEFDEIITWWQRNFPQIIITLIEVDRVWDGENSNFYNQRKAGRGDILKLLPTSDHDLVFLGLRDEESNRRRHANAQGLLRQYAHSRPKNLRDMYVCTPIARFSTRDIATYSIQNNLPVFNIYHELGFEQRTTLRLTGDAVRRLAFQRLRITAPDKYNILLQRFPELHWWNG